ncbi:hypothetical protein FAZ69_02910 [Trinickia terrae]|uniref:Uncharacterized protein n=1 Tax=Trinickia terrae TaxID=2571161 RepID=A0A4U1IFV2_9BURK|nr:hypothetical protein FAZ69_02910 [Trinickia terrae]
MTEPISFCPHCGATARVALGTGSAAAASASASPAAAAPASPGKALPRVELAGTPRPVPLFAAAGMSPSPIPDGARHWGLSHGAGWTLAAFAVLFGGFVLLRQFNSPETRIEEMMSRTVVGSVTPGLELPASASATPAAPLRPASVAPPAAATGQQRNAALHGAPALSAQAAQEQAQLQAQAAAKMQAQAQAQAQAKLQAQAQARSQAQAQAQAKLQAQAQAKLRAQARAAAEPALPALPPLLSRAPVAAQAPAPAKTPVLAPTPTTIPAAAQTTASAAAPDSTDRHGKAPPRDLQSIQANLQKNDLTDAHAALSEVLAAQPDNGDAQRMRQELQAREQARDAALRVARGCAQQGLWTCVWHNAGDALAADSGSAEAKSLIARSIRESGWGKASQAPAPAPEQTNSQ